MSQTSLTYNGRAPITEHDEQERYIPDELREYVLRRDRWKCRYCGVSLRFTEYELDHIYPFSLGGLTVAENLAASCRECNRKKSDKLGIHPKPPEYWYLERRSRAVNLPFAAVGVILVGLWLLTLSLVWLGSTPGAVAGGGAVVAGLSMVYGWTKRGGLR